MTEIRWILLTIMNGMYVWRQFTLDKMKVWVAQSCPTLWPYAMWPTRLLCPWNSPSKNTWVGCHFLLQRHFPTQGSNLGLLLCRRIIIWATRESQIKLEESSIQRASLVAQVKASACSAGDLGFIPGSGRSPGEGNGNPLQHSCLENSMGYNLWGCKESDTTKRHFLYDIKHRYQNIHIQKEDLCVCLFAYMYTSPGTSGALSKRTTYSSLNALSITQPIIMAQERQ